MWSLLTSGLFSLVSKAAGKAASARGHSHDALILDDEGVVTRFRHQISHTQFINKAEEV